jgi:sterol carrier protein 2
MIVCVAHRNSFCSPTSDGSGAAILVSEKFLAEHPHARRTAVEILAIEMATDLPSTFDSNDCMRIVRTGEVNLVSRFTSRS